VHAETRSELRGCGTLRHDGPYLTFEPGRSRTQSQKNGGSSPLLLMIVVFRLTSIRSCRASAPCSRTRTDKSESFCLRPRPPPFHRRARATVPSPRGNGWGPESVELVMATRQALRLSHVRKLQSAFNVSHSEGVAVYAFALGTRDRIDVEAIGVIHDADDIAARFFSRCEYERIAPSTDATGRWAFSIAGRARKRLHQGAW